MNGGKTWSSLRPVVQPETQEECEYYRYPFSNTPAKQSHDGYQLLVGDRLFLFFGWNKGSQPPVGEKIPRTEEIHDIFSSRREDVMDVVARMKTFIKLVEDLDAATTED